MNKVILIGRLAKDPQLKYAEGSGKAVSNFTVAVNRIKKKDQEKSNVDFINCVAFDKTAETLAQYFSKGKQIALIGNIRTSSYTDKNNEKKYSTKIVVDSFEFIGYKNGNNESRNDNNDGYDEITPVDDGEMPF